MCWFTSVSWRLYEGASIIMPIQQVRKEAQRSLCNQYKVLDYIWYLLNSRTEIETRAVSLRAQVTLDCDVVLIVQMREWNGQEKLCNQFKSHTQMKDKSTLKHSNIPGWGQTTVLEPKNILDQCSQIMSTGISWNLLNKCLRKDRCRCWADHTLDTSSESGRHHISHSPNWRIPHNQLCEQYFYLLTHGN